MDSLWNTVETVIPAAGCSVIGVLVFWLGYHCAIALARAFIL